ncbi:sensor histidine kinase [Haloplanus halophilus]|uniref:sensor histidine kinase n=1 Tax=Haloplanus halophilus TaxID=2949993 RepID=UPI002041AD0D|nr:HAMP domain-containing sensor histidine kinase [Haloplanus sp. GDY1]
MTDEHRAAITFDGYPDPLLAYAVEGDEPRITATNDAFQAAFDGPSAGQPVGVVFERCRVVDSTGDADPVTHLRRGDCAGIYLDGVGEVGPFFARIVPSDDDTGRVVFSDVSDCPEIADSPAIDRVGSVISHDLRNPLDVAEAHLRAARETGDAEHFDAVAAAHDRMERIIRDVLTITRNRTAVDPSDDVAIDVAATDAWESVDTGRATLEVANELPTVTADSDRVRRLFENLFRNAVEHGPAVDDRSAEREREATPESGVHVTVGALEDGFCVADDGAGIPPDERGAVFDPGYSTRDDGTGLGLAIVERIVAAHDWTITLTTATDGGARFEIRF